MARQRVWMTKRFPFDSKGCDSVPSDSMFTFSSPDHESSVSARLCAFLALPSGPRQLRRWPVTPNTEKAGHESPPRPAVHSAQFSRRQTISEANPLLKIDTSTRVAVASRRLTALFFLSTRLSQ